MSSLTRRSGPRLAGRLVSARVCAVHSMGMNSPTPATEIFAVAEDRETIEAARRANYRRFTAVVLGLDVATLASELRATRLMDEDLPLAA